MKKLSNFKIIGKILKNLKNSIGPKKYYSIFFMGFLTSITTIIEPFFFIQIISKIENFYKIGTFDFGELSFHVFIWCTYIIFNLIITYINRYFFVDKSCLKYYLYNFEKYCNIILKIEYNEFLSKKSGELYSILNKGIKDSFSLLFFIFLEIIKNMSGILLVIIVLFYINPIMTLASLSMLPALIFIGYFFNKKTVGLQKEVNDFDDKNYGILADSITNTQLVKTLNLEKTIFKNLSKNINKSYLKQIPISLRWSFSDVKTGFLVVVARIIVVLVGVYLISIGKLPLSLLFLYFYFIGWIYFPLSMIFARLRHIQEQLTSTGKFFQTFESLKIENNLSTGGTIKKLDGNIEFKNVYFSYTDDKKIFENLNFSINSGDKIAFVGNTGAGKSTIVNLLFRFWDINTGEILLDGKNINEFKKESLRKHIGIVSQDNSLFNDSIKNNLLFAKKNATKKDLENCLKKAQADFVFEFKDGIDTVIGERGLKLSGGEKQRLSIARLFLKNPEILILDEATSALDNKTEKLIQKALDKLMKGRTSIVIAHRLSTIQNSDRIFMFEKGKIVENGNYDYLMKKKGKFYELANPDNLIIN